MKRSRQTKRHTGVSPTRTSGLGRDSCSGTNLLLWGVSRWWGHGYRVRVGWMGAEQQPKWLRLAGAHWQARSCREWCSRRLRVAQACRRRRRCGSCKSVDSRRASAQRFVLTCTTCGCASAQVALIRHRYIVAASRRPQHVKCKQKAQRRGTWPGPAVGAVGAATSCGSELASASYKLLTQVLRVASVRT